MRIIFTILLCFIFPLSSRSEIIWCLYTDGDINFPERVSVLEGKYTENSNLDIIQNTQEFKIKGIVYASSGSVFLSFQPKKFSVEGNSITMSLVNLSDDKVKAFASFNGSIEGESLTPLMPFENGIANINNLQMGLDNRAVFNITGKVQSISESQPSNYKGEFDLIITSL